MQIANLSDSEDDKLKEADARVLVGKDTKYPVPLSMTNRKYRLRLGRQLRLQASPQSMRKSVLGGEKSGVVALALVVAPSPMPELAESFAVPDIFGINLSNVRIVRRVL